MIPSLVDVPGAPWPLLPPGIHQATVDEVGAMFATNSTRAQLFAGFVDACGRLKSAGCSKVYLDGSFVSEKDHPGDFDACWDPAGVDGSKLDPVFLNFDPGRATQKREFGGEFFPSTVPADAFGRTYIDFFQQDRITGNPKGIIAISL